MKRTPFYGSQVAAGGKMTQGPWENAFEFTSVKEEHESIRNKVGLTDYSIMGEIDVKGKDAFDFLQKMIVNDMNRIEPGKILYTTLLTEEGVILDDVTIYCFSQEHYWVITSTPQRFNVVKWLNDHITDELVYLTDITAGVGLLSVQGPLSRKMLQPLADIDLSSIEYFNFKEGKLSGIDVIFSRTGFTGELGYELLVGADDAKELWDVVVEAGNEYDAKPCGMGASAFTIAIEKGFITGREYLTTKTNPLEVGLGWTVRWDKGDFVGREALLAVKENGIEKKLMGISLDNSDETCKIGDEVLVGGEVVGKITTAAFGYTVGTFLGMAFIAVKYANVDQEVSIKTDKGMVTGRLAHKIFYDPKGLRTKDCELAL